MKLSSAVVLGAFVGLICSVGMSCGPTNYKARCQPSNCNGCCDAEGTCRNGSELDACGSLGTSCSICASTQLCDQGMCRGDTGVHGGNDAGNTTDAGTDGGNNNTTACSPSNCSGCCKNNECHNGDLASACGVAGGACTTCPGGQNCVGGQCSNTCSGCLDAAANCQTGTSINACGANGNICVACLSDQVCDNGQCKSTSCSASNCNGCCDGTTCITTNTDAQCGTGGQACMSCQNGATCQSGQCQGGNTGNDGGFQFPDGGFSFCPNANECLDLISGLCLDGTSDPLACGVGGGICSVCLSFVCTMGVCQ